MNHVGSTKWGEGKVMINRINPTTNILDLFIQKLDYFIAAIFNYQERKFFYISQKKRLYIIRNYENKNMKILPST